MTTNDAYRTNLIEAVRRAQAEQEVKEMTDAELGAVLCSELGLAAGTTFTDAQLQMIIEHG